MVVRLFSKVASQLISYAYTKPHNTGAIKFEYSAYAPMATRAMPSTRWRFSTSVFQLPPARLAGSTSQASGSIGSLAMMRLRMLKVSKNEYIHTTRANRATGVIFKSVPSMMMSMNSTTSEVPRFI